MPYIINSADPHDIIALFVAPRFDQHVRAYRRHRYARQIAADAARSLDDLTARLRALRSRKLFAEGTPRCPTHPQCRTTPTAKNWPDNLKSAPTHSGRLASTLWRSRN